MNPITIVSMICFLIPSMLIVTILKHTNVAIKQSNPVNLEANIDIRSILIWGDKAGLVPNSAQNSSGDYHGNYNGVTQWLNKQFLPNLPEPFLIYLGNAIYHCAKPKTWPNWFEDDESRSSFFTQRYWSRTMSKVIGPHFAHRCRIVKLAKETPINFCIHLSITATCSPLTMVLS